MATVFTTRIYINQGNVQVKRGNSKKRSGGGQSYLWRVEWGYYPKHHKLFRNKTDAMFFMGKLQKQRAYDVSLRKWCP